MYSDKLNATRHIAPISHPFPPKMFSSNQESNYSEMSRNQIGRLRATSYKSYEKLTIILVNFSLEHCVNSSPRDRKQLKGGRFQSIGGMCVLVVTRGCIALAATFDFYDKTLSPKQPCVAIRHGPRPL